MTDGYHIDINRCGAGRFSVTTHGLMKNETHFFDHYRASLNKARELAEAAGLWIHDYVTGNPTMR